MGSALHDWIANGVLPIVLVLCELVGSLGDVSVVMTFPCCHLLRIISKPDDALVRPVPIVVGGCSALTWGGALPARLSGSERSER
jgi:hypothetical protein